MTRARPRYGLPFLLGFAAIALALVALPALCVIVASVFGP